MSHHEIPQSERGYKELKNLHSPLTPPIYLPPATSTKKESKAEAERKDLAAR
jgi:hypothetical protein